MAYKCAIRINNVYVIEKVNTNLLTQLKLKYVLVFHQDKHQAEFVPFGYLNNAEMNMSAEDCRITKHYIRVGICFVY